MAWTAPMTWSTGPIVTAAHLNEQIRDNVTYLKAETDRIDNITSDDVAASRNINITYQNTASSIRFAMVTVKFTASDGDTANIKIGSTSPPATSIALAGHTGWASGSFETYIPLTFVVPSQFYYTVSSDGFYQDWHEWNILYPS